MSLIKFKFINDLLSRIMMKYTLRFINESNLGQNKLIDTPGAQKFMQQTTV